ncbi:kinase-like protein [Polychaeton citri CBS 116435]|uniref:mitogen-activated protein kinase kinase n=1 Tax=Polychaeton citri CBS 116435 TaxID=1314669 RepID=A0A9P4UUZ2_9PEZI|nr:kinase-like protein [Polychaeton citri CBS 116435]
MTPLRTRTRNSSEYAFPLPSGQQASPSSARSSLEVQHQHDDFASFAFPHELTPPVSPTTAKAHEDSDGRVVPEILNYDFTRLDYELERAKVLGTGLWSTVYLTYSAPPAASLAQPSRFTPPTTPSKSANNGATSSSSTSSLYAVKVPARPDASEILYHEARMLTRLQTRADAAQYIVAFDGLDTRNSALVFEAALGGSLESMNSRLKQLTEVARHRELVHSFPRLALDLISGLEFIHSSGIVHADIKPANILLDIDPEGDVSPAGTPIAVVRARYIDFSAAFRVDRIEECPEQAGGGTWEFMAPEQMRIQKELNTPTFASDVWSLGITLLTLIVGGSPYAAACAPNNLFMLREAIKTGDPLSFARMDVTAQTRMVACQNFIDCCRLALKKDRENRTSAAMWRSWLSDHQLWNLVEW